MRPRLMQRGYKFTGRHADRNKHLYELYRRGARADALALACGLTRARLYQIVAEGNGGSVRARYVDEVFTRSR
jgi:hypothetical protein